MHSFVFGRTKKIYFFVGSTAIVILTLITFLVNDSRGQITQTIAGVEYKQNITSEYSFYYPSGWYVNDQTNIHLPYVAVANMNPEAVKKLPINSRGQYFKFEIVRLSNPSNLTLDQWVESFINESPSHPEVISSESILVSGENAIKTIEKVRDFLHPMVYVLHGEYIYLINAPTMTKETEGVFGNILLGFNFTL